MLVFFRKPSCAFRSVGARRVPGAGEFRDDLTDTEGEEDERPRGVVSGEGGEQEPVFSALAKRQWHPATAYAFDSTTIDLCLSLFPWARFRRREGAVKLHTLIDLRGNIPCFIRISDGKMHDVRALAVDRSAIKTFGSRSEPRLSCGPTPILSVDKALVARSASEGIRVVLGRSLARRASQTGGKWVRESSYADNASIPG